MRLLFLLLVPILLIGCTKDIQYIDRVVYVYPEDAHLRSNGTVALMPPEQYRAMDIDRKLEYSNSLVGEYSNLYGLCMADKRAIQTWATTHKQRHLESSTGQKP